MMKLGKELGLERKRFVRIYRKERKITFLKGRKERERKAREGR